MKFIIYTLRLINTLLMVWVLYHYFADIYARDIEKLMPFLEQTRFINGAKEENALIGLFVLGIFQFISALLLLFIKIHQKWIKIYFILVGLYVIYFEYYHWIESVFASLIPTFLIGIFFTYILWKNVKPTTTLDQKEK